MTTIPAAATDLYAAIDRFKELLHEPEPRCLACDAGRHCNWHPNKEPSLSDLHEAAAFERRVQYYMELGEVRANAERQAMRDAEHRPNPINQTDEE